MKPAKANINLLPAEFKIGFWFRATPVGRMCSAGILLLLSLSFSLGSVYAWQFYRQCVLADAYKQVAGDMEQVTMAAGYREQAAKVKRQRAIVLSARKPYLQWLNQILINWPPAVKTDEIRLEPQRLRITGSADNQGAVTGLLRLLENDPYLAELMNLELELSSAGEAVRFVFEYSWAK